MRPSLILPEDGKRTRNGVMRSKTTHSPSDNGGYRVTYMSIANAYFEIGLVSAVRRQNSAEPQNQGLGSVIQRQVHAPIHP